MPVFSNTYKINATGYSIVESYFTVNQNIVKSEVKCKISTPP